MELQMGSGLPDIAVEANLLQRPRAASSVNPFIIVQVSQEMKILRTENPKGCCVQVLLCVVSGFRAHEISHPVRKFFFFYALQA